MAAPLTTTVDLVARFPGIVSADTRPGYTGFIVNKETSGDVETADRDAFGSDLWTASPAVD